MHGQLNVALLAPPAVTGSSSEASVSPPGFFASDAAKRAETR